MKNNVCQRIQETATLLLIIAAIATDITAQQTQFGVPLSRIERLRRGDNLEQGAYGGSVDEGDIKSLKQQGYTTARIGIHPGWIYSNGEPKSSGIDYYKKCLSYCKKHDIGCILDIHRTSSRNLSDYMTDKFVTFWGKLAKELSSTDPEYAFFEIINEPTPPTRNDMDWYFQQDKVMRAIRENAPDHTIVIVGSQCFLDSSEAGGDSGINWDQIDALMRFKMPKGITNIVMKTHYYRPMPFTHQGSAWVGFFGEIKNVKYPADAANVAAAKNKVTHPWAKSSLDDYLKQNWGPERFDARFKMVADWRYENGNPYVYIGEFGATSKTGGGRDQYYRDIITAMEKYNVGWMPWWKASKSAMQLDKPLEKYDPHKGNPEVVATIDFSIAEKKSAIRVPTVPGAGNALFDLSGKLLPVSMTRGMKKVPGTYILRTTIDNGVYTRSLVTGK
jgi:aryl-phospho-beta-D-glucosidase BglC (GH1 family)